MIFSLFLSGTLAVWAFGRLSHPNGNIYHPCHHQGPNFTFECDKNCYKLRNGEKISFEYLSDFCTEDYFLGEKQNLFYNLELLLYL